MTVSYQLDVANVSFANSRLLGRWKGSIYKLFLREFAVFVFLYTALSLLYRFILDAGQRK